jgi:photosystem II stability/assembly factor-like uncharacterized protein
MKRSSNRHGAAPQNSLVIIGKGTAPRQARTLENAHEKILALSPPNRGNLRTMRVLRLLCLAPLLSLGATSAQAQWWTVQTSGIDTSLRAVSAAWVPDATGEPHPIVWASGSNGVILRSADEGKTWKRLHIKDADSLDFRGIAALDDKIAYAMSIGNGDKSRIYKTADAGETWKLQFTGPRKETFLDAISCESKTACVVLGDPIDGKFLLMSTEDGEHWKELPREALPAALPGEGAFAASNSSLCLDNRNIYFGTGGAAKARLFRSSDSGKTWTVEDTPISSGNASSGIFSLSCKDGRILHAVGGDYNDPSRVFHSAATYYDGVSLPDKPRGWQLSKQQPGGFRSGVGDVDGARVVAVGPNGEDITQDFGVTWQHTDSLNLNAVFILDVFQGWAVGPHGTIARFVNKVQYRVRHEPPATEPSGKFPRFGLLDFALLSTLAGPSHADFSSSPQARGSISGGPDVIQLH